MTTDFDAIIDRRNTHSTKWDDIESRCGVAHPDPIPLWVADMDFRAPQAVTDMLRKAVDHGVFGYYGARDSFYEAQAGWMKCRHDWDIQAEWSLVSHGLLNGIAVLLQALSAPGDGVIVFSPVYYQFMELIRKNNRRLVASELVVQDNRYHMDLDALQQQLTGDEKILLLCSPHNPGGRIWTPEELRALADFCVRNDIIICSDEIHHDLVMPGHKHHLMAKVAPDVEDRLITMAATSKTFNIAGIETGSMFISDRKLRERIMPVYNAMAISPNRFGMTMAEAAYRGGDQWLDDLMVYLDRNRRQLNATIASIPGLSVMDLESTYLGWVDCSGTGMSADEVLKRLYEKGVVPSVGGTFGIGGEDYIRLNIACRHAMFDDAMDRVTEAFSDLQ